MNSLSEIISSLICILPLRYHCGLFEFMLYYAAFLALLVPGIEAKDNGLARTPPMGWNSWNHFACDISEELIKETADAILDTGLQSMGYEYINLDDCWQASERDMEGRIMPDAERFPSGMKALGDYLHERGFKFGIYSSAGFKTCEAYPASLGREEIDAEVYASWGVDYLKYDNCYTDFGVPEKRYPPMSEALDQAGRPVVYSLCEWGRANPATWADKISNLWRGSADISDGWYSIMTRAAITAPLWRYAGPGGWNDPDMLEVGNGGCSFDEYKTHFSMWAMLKSPLIIGNDVRTMKAGDEAMTILSNKEIIDINQDSLGWQARRIWSDRSEHNPIFKGRGDRLIAAKCSQTKSTNTRQQDAVEDQKWTLQADGTIMSHSTGMCLTERQERPQSTEDEELLESFGTNVSSLSELDFSFGRGRVTTEDCVDATKWDVGVKTGGAIVSRDSGMCLEVASNPLVVFTDGKRLQMASCKPEMMDGHKFLNIRENQGWTQPSGVTGAQLLNLYQRQCLTVDRDAPLGLRKEIWSTTLADGDLAVMMLNKGKLPAHLSASWEMLGLEEGTKVTTYDLWSHERKRGRRNQVSSLVAPHGVVMFRLSVEE
mmetsp:Transcript_2013/g.3583  ORF Transcript_2013/g.3583 Transcript_2013/m.3583 type:complete len:602 (+) Transcript_2013:2-1807(+)